MSDHKKAYEIISRYLERNGYLIFEQKYHYEQGMLPFIAYKQERIIFILLRREKTPPLLPGVETLSQEEIRQWKNTAYAYLYEKELTNFPYQFDLIEIILEDEEQIRHYENIAL